MPLMGMTTENMKPPPHRPSVMCVDTCDNPIVCREEYDAYQEAAA